MATSPSAREDLQTRYRNRYRALIVVSLLLAAGLSASVYELRGSFLAPGTAALQRVNLTAVYVGENNSSFSPVSAYMSWMGGAPYPLQGTVGSEGSVGVSLDDSSTTSCMLWAFWVHPPFGLVAWHVQNRTTNWLAGGLPIGIEGKVPSGSGWSTTPTGIDLNLTLPPSPGVYDLGLTVVLTC